MRSCRADRLPARGRGGFGSATAGASAIMAIALAAALNGGGAAAQVGPPIRLGPPAAQPGPMPQPMPLPAPEQPDAPQTGKPQQEAPRQPEPDPPVAATPPTSTAEPRQIELPRMPAGIEVAPIGAIDPDSVGVLSEADGGFGPDMWRGTGRALLERLLPTMPGANGSPAMRSLARRMLLTQAAAPAPTGEPDARGLLATRVERLIAIGDAAGALDLIRAAPQRTVDDDVARGELEILFYTGDSAGACARVRGLRRDATPYLQRAAAFCLAHDGDLARAVMMAGLLREQSSDAGDPFFGLIESLAGGAAPALDTRDPSGLQLAMLRAANAPPPAAAASSRNGAVLRALTFSALAPMETRLAAAEHAYASGAIGEDDIVRLYNAVGFTAERIATPFANAEDGWGPVARALLIRTAAAAVNPGARADTLQRTLTIAAKKGGRNELLRIGGIVARDLDPGQIPPAFAADAVRMLLAVGANDFAAAWMQRADADMALELWPLAQVAGASDAWDSTRFAAWLGRVRKAAPGAADARAAMLISLCSGLGGTIPAADWAAAMGSEAAQRPAPGPILLQLLKQAAAGNRLGETILLALVAIGDVGPGGAHPVALSAAISALGAVGLAAEAREIAVEAALAAGL
jgi:hypothetical protein